MKDEFDCLFFVGIIFFFFAFIENSLVGKRNFAVNLSVIQRIVHAGGEVNKESSQVNETASEEPDGGNCRREHQFTGIQEINGQCRYTQ